MPECGSNVPSRSAKSEDSALTRARRAGGLPSRSANAELKSAVDEVRSKSIVR